VPGALPDYHVPEGYEFGELAVQVGEISNEAVKHGLEFARL
jgi:hypothetical protein